jgi:hypothetical protein
VRALNNDTHTHTERTAALQRSLLPDGRTKPPLTVSRFERPEQNKSSQFRALCVQTLEDLAPAEIWKVRRLLKTRREHCLLWQGAFLKLDSSFAP